MRRFLAILSLSVAGVVGLAAPATAGPTVVQPYSVCLNCF